MMNAPQSVLNLSALNIAKELAKQFAQTAAERDKAGGNPKFERDLIRKSGLLSLAIPQQYGGQGADWKTIFQTVQTIAQVDSSLAHVYAFHHLLIATVQLFAQPEQYQQWFEQTVQQHLFWGNTLNPLDKRTTVQQVSENEFIFHGDKSFCSGSIDSDILLCSGFNDADQLLIAVIPTQREGVSFLGDWNNMGQRQTDSGTSHFEQVKVYKNELLLNPGPLSTPYSSLRPLIAQLIFVHLFLGVAEGAFEVARQSIQTQKAWSKSLAEQAIHDPYIQTHFADFYVQLQSVRLLTEQAVEALQAAWNIGEDLTEQQRGQVSIAIATAKIAATNSSLFVTQNIFQVLGARATTAQLNLDRFWRNVRTQTLHDPIDYKYQEVGEWVLTGKVPDPSFYS
ncbi:acyl-CoA dehydrogenase family protein [Acinetobacter bereziniae]|uniref:Acyl-CoA dehydrogenase family protein n=1 Tax=Acinetobacter bereziniae TaxID=106648 RepID=A0A8I1DIR9_ACIBZ|nr:MULTISPECIES: acyl-CoA dehydrogenase family protein [Acinetobacter]MEC8125019.1 acyl-CoA dehydrogenase family protein [Pseudomonadota bacterium]MBJ9950736.1 acyl-CoA dehydrogenase family protein [Acinetobacter bereziniae]MCU4474959.1 acyl-CoA dehydrogenase family protein [Acinetobacter bereziniae]MCU4543174.1 acyl-CoA dehydrogenase family protein [Acinetobacter bereziniae]MCU4627238.1 acyl-CoA dehydrogenase family protein [Acinetobacter bereziniae]